MLNEFNKEMEVVKEFIASSKENMQNAKGIADLIKKSYEELIKEKREEFLSRLPKGTIIIASLGWAGRKLHYRVGYIANAGNYLRLEVYLYPKEEGDNYKILLKEIKEAAPINEEEYYDREWKEDGNCVWIKSRYLDDESIDGYLIEKHEKPEDLGEEVKNINREFNHTIEGIKKCFGPVKS